jgi:hypothetical protein
LLRWPDVPLGERTGLTVAVVDDAGGLAAAQRWFGEGPSACVPAWAAEPVGIQHRGEDLNDHRRGAL